MWSLTSCSCVKSVKNSCITINRGLSQKANKLKNSGSVNHNINLLIPLLIMTLIKNSVQTHFSFQLQRKMSHYPQIKPEASHLWLYKTVIKWIHSGMNTAVRLVSFCSLLINVQMESAVQNSVTCRWKFPELDKRRALSNK